MHKTQIFNANVGDHYRNRLTHTLEVSQIARSLCKMLGLNEELGEAIAIAHDVGHTPFGHIGERTLHMIMSGRMSEFDHEFSKNNFGGFKHNYQSLQLLDNIEKRSFDYNGLNLTFAVREGIFKHTSRRIRIPEEDHTRNITKFVKDKISYSSLDLINMNIDNCSITLEGQVVAIADEIAQCTHDLEDGIRSGIISFDDLKNNELIQIIMNEYKINQSNLKETVDIRNTVIRQLIGYLISDVYKETKANLFNLEEENKLPKYTSYEDVYKNQVVNFSNDDRKIREKQGELSKFITKIVIASQSVTQADKKAEYIIKKLYKAYYLYPQQLPDYILKRYYDKNGREFDRMEIDSEVLELRNDREFNRLICDHISGMSDQYAAREYRKLYEPEFF